MNTLFKALNDPTRRQILDLLREGDLNAGDIAERFDMTKPSISHHLDLLRQAGLVEATKQGQFVNYSLNTTVMDELLAWLLSFQKAPEAEKIPLKNTP
ncbi:autorepressor SdpR family transcription factor [Spirosoma aerolatum]|uniref:autorepressor SdpR family transcription factor n=1 Tax=Spirosoma aerolatum TaxID=1211326 RepID=UPI0009ACD970|nr:autorepressor SdpR family transcription factor [Spirosoma aerolatum]